MTSRTNSQAFAELYYTREIITELLGRTPLCWRPPYGDVDDRIRFIANKLNLTLHLWSDDTFDWQVGLNGVTMDNITANYNKVFEQAKSGKYKDGNSPIVLNHEVNAQTMNEIINQYPNIKSNFKYIVPVASGLNVTNPYAEQNLTYPTFAEVTGNSEGAPAGSSNGTTPASTESTTNGTTNGSGSAGNGSASASGSSSASGSKNSTTSGKGDSGASTLLASSGLVVVGASLSLLL